MANAGDTFRLGGHETVTVIRSAADTGGEVLEVEAVWEGGGDPPPSHYHPAQDENFEVLEGALRTSIGGVERVYTAGETFVIPRGTHHDITAAGGAPARARWETKPALRTEEWFEALSRAAEDGLLPPGRKPPLLVAAGILSGFRGEMRLATPPEPIQGALIGVLGRLGRLRMA
jgi:quercetin dioxygenase-like cupin family protein